MVDRLRDQLLLQGFGITLTEEARSAARAEGFDSTLGARPLRRAIQRSWRTRCPSRFWLATGRPATSSRCMSKTGSCAFRKGEGNVCSSVAPSAPERGQHCEDDGRAQLIAAAVPPPAARPASSADGQRAQRLAVSELRCRCSALDGSLQRLRRVWQIR